MLSAVSPVTTAPIISPPASTRLSHFASSGVMAFCVGISSGASTYSCMMRSRRKSYHENGMPYSSGFMMLASAIQMRLRPSPGGHVMWVW
jgi:hypothetical protein